MIAGLGNSPATHLFVSFSFLATLSWMAKCLNMLDEMVLPGSDLVQGGTA